MDELVGLNKLQLLSQNVDSLSTDEETVSLPWEMSVKGDK